MPFKSAAQRRLFQAVAHNKKFARKVKISQSTAKRLIKKDKRK